MIVLGTNMEEIKNNNPGGLICSLFGHRSIYKYPNLEERLLKQIEQLILLGYTIFYVGRHGDFDFIAYCCLRKIRKNYPYIKINIVFTGRELLGRREEKGIWEDAFRDVETVYFPVEDEHFKRRITVTNQMMIDLSDVVVLLYDPFASSAGVKNAFKYAKKEGKKIINLYSEEEYLEIENKYKEKIKTDFPHLK